MLHHFAFALGLGHLLGKILHDIANLCHIHVRINILHNAGRRLEGAHDLLLSLHAGDLHGH